MSRFLLKACTPYKDVNIKIIIFLISGKLFKEIRFFAENSTFLL